MSTSETVISSSAEMAGVSEEDPPDSRYATAYGPIQYTIEYVKLWPAGNMTALVTNRLPRSIYSDVSRDIIAQDPSIEQVGFIEPASNPKALARLQMMGGEFCGNATRSIAQYLYTELAKKNPFMKRHFMMEVSGIDRLISVEIKENGEVEIALPVNHYNEKNLFRTCENGTLVRLDGIWHFITNFPRFAGIKADLLKLRGYYELKNEGLLDAEVPAIGVIYMQKMADGMKTHPLIWVKDTDTFIFETGCASGTLAAAMVRARSMEKGTQVTKILQPSGEFLTTTISKRAGKMMSALISGKVDIREEGKTVFHAKQRLPFFIARPQIAPAAF